MPQYLLDTDICIHFLKGQFNLKEKLEQVEIENCYVSEITIAELLFGAFNSQNLEKHLNEVSKIEQLFSVLPIYDSLSIYGKEKSRLKKAGQPLPDFDLRIGTASVHHNMILVSNNTRHLSRIQGVQLENWTMNV